MQRLDLEAVKGYALRYAAKLCEESFPKGYRLTGEDIVSACDVRQVNTLVVKSIFLTWKKHISHLQSSFFDYSHPNIQKLIAQLSTELSRHILMPVAEYQVFLAEAVADTIHFALEPSSFIRTFLSPYQQESALESEEVLSAIKYLVLHPRLINSIVSDIDNCGTMIFGQDIRDIVLARSTQTELFDNESQTIERLKAFLDFDENLWWCRDNHQPAIGENLEKQDFEPLHEEEDDSLPSGGDVPELRDLWLDESELPVIQSSKGTESELPDLLSEGTAYDLDNQHKISPISVSSANESRFIEGLFGGDALEYQRAMERIGQCRTYSEALAFLKEAYAKRYNWQTSGVILGDFLEMVDDRFA